MIGLIYRGHVTSDVVPVALALIGDLFPYEERGGPLGWLFGAIAGGMAFGSTIGVVLEPLVGWRILFLGVAIYSRAFLAYLFRLRTALDESKRPRVLLSFSEVLRTFGSLLTSARGLSTYLYVFLSAVFHSGVYMWLGLYFVERHRLGEVGIGLALLGYGVPGFLVGPAMGRLVDRRGPERTSPGWPWHQCYCRSHSYSARSLARGGTCRYDAVVRLRHDAATSSGHCHQVGRGARRPSNGIECNFTLHWIWYWAPSLWSSTAARIGKSAHYFQLG